jgi:hypothetical protein
MLVAPSGTPPRGLTRRKQENLDLDLISAVDRWFNHRAGTQADEALALSDVLQPERAPNVAIR